MSIDIFFITLLIFIVFCFTICCIKTIYYLLTLLRVLKEDVDFVYVCFVIIDLLFFFFTGNDFLNLFCDLFLLGVDKFDYASMLGSMIFLLIMLFCTKDDGWFVKKKKKKKKNK